MEQDLDRDRLHRAFADIAAPLCLHLCLRTGHPLSAPLGEFARSLADAAGGGIKLELETDESANLPARPGLVLSYMGQPNVRYLALPQGPELEPFLEMLEALPQKTRASAAWETQLAGLADPTQVWVFIAAACPHCPHAVRAAVAMSLLSPLVTTTVIDVGHFPELTERYNARSVPLTVIDNGLSLTGAIKPQELADDILARDQADYAGRVFASLVEVGRFAAAAEQLRHGSVLPFFATHWRQSTLSTRMGLLLTAEKALEQTPRALDALVDPLIELARTDSTETALRGDSVDLLGKIGDPSAKPILESLSRDPNPDIAEIAAESLESMGGEHGAQ